MGRDGGGRPPPVNARRETVATNGMFKKAYQSRRCLVPVDGYFEWQKLDASGKKKQPYAIAMKSDEPFAMAGLYEEYSDKATGELVRTFCIVTCEPNDLMGPSTTGCRSLCRRQSTCAGLVRNPFQWICWSRFRPN